MSESHPERRPYDPPMSPDQNYVEINAYVVGWGLFFAALFSLAVGYLCLKIGQTVDAFAPVSVLAMGMAVLFKRKNAFPETVHIQAIASAGTNIIGGVMFILPALFILQLDSQLTYTEMVIPIVLGGVLGVLLADAPIDAVFSQYVRHIGIGMLAMAGIIGLVSMSGVVGRVIRRAASDLFTSGPASSAGLLRTQQDLPMSQIVTGTLAMCALFTLFFHVTCSQNITQTLLAGAIILIFSFLLSVVGISSIAFTGNEPVSGMTIFMIIVSAVFMGNAGMSGSSGIIAILLMAAFLCSTLAVAGNFMSELKVAYLTGATPKKMQQWQILSIIVSSFIAVGVIFLLDHAYGYTGSGALAAPQANAMAAIVKPMMDGGAAPWPLYMAGAFFAFLLWMMKVPPLAFALGAYLPMEINTPVLIGGLVSYFVSHSSKDDALNALRLSEGSTVASGFVAGGAIGSLISAVLHIGGIDWFLKDWVVTPGATYLGIVAYLVMCAVIYTVACKVKKV